jgi:PIN domain nuclease of toxin-antitoxin system
MIVLDTVALLYWTLDPGNLSHSARKAIEDADRLVVSSISIWEIALKVKNGKIQIPLPVLEYIERLQRLETLEIQPVDFQGWLDNIKLDWEHRDPADRTIVGLATRLGCPLVTSDGVISRFYPSVIW